MNEDIFSGKWHQFKGKIKENWGKLTDDDLTRINGKREKLLGALEERYGWQKQRAEDELRKYEQTFSKKERSSKEEPFRDYRDEKENDEGDERRSKKRKIG